MAIFEPKDTVHYCVESILGFMVAQKGQYSGFCPVSSNLTLLRVETSGPMQSKFSTMEIMKN